MQIRAVVGLCVLALLSTVGAGPETPFQSFAAFKTTVSYEFSCTHDVFTIAIEAVKQVPGAEGTLYWEVWDSGQRSLGDVVNVATLNTLQVQAPAGVAAQADSGLGVLTHAYRPCAGQSLYVWPASSAQKLPNGDIVLRFSDAVEQPLAP